MRTQKPEVRLKEINTDSFNYSNWLILNEDLVKLIENTEIQKNNNGKYQIIHPIKFAAVS